MVNDDNYTSIKKWRMKKEEIDELKEFDNIVVHNSRMKEYIVKKHGIPEGRIISLELFDYLINDSIKLPETTSCSSCIIAGNFRRFKASYVYDLPAKSDFELYGDGFDGNEKDNVHYHGSFLSEELPAHLCGGFGLVWDGDSIDTCSGAWGNYLKYNNPHKTSLYLSCGIPVIIWEQAAIADYILENKVGMVVSSLSDISEKISEMSDEQYLELKRNAVEMSKKLRTGYHTIKVLKKCNVI